MRPRYQVSPLPMLKMESIWRKLESGVDFQTDARHWHSCNRRRSCEHFNRDLRGHRALHNACSSTVCSSITAVVLVENGLAFIIHLATEILYDSTSLAFV